MSAYLLLALSAFAGQALLFVPIVPLLLGTGALVAHGQLRIAGAIVASVVGIGLGDFLWYTIGRRRGRPLLARICRRAMEPGTCVRRTERVFGRFGARALLFAKFIPGLSTVALPLAGVFRMRTRRFLIHDLCGATLWVSAYVAAGSLSTHYLGIVSGWRPHFGMPTVAAALAGIAAYLLWKQVARSRLRRQLEEDRLPVDELQRMMRDGEPVAIVDIRHPIDFESDPYVIPGALYIPAEDLDRRHREIPRDREVVLYCTCPDELTSAAESRRLRKHGVARVRPLDGGFTAWRGHGMPVVLRGPIVLEDARILNAL